MKSKEKVLANIMSKIESLRIAYDTMKALPDDVFETMSEYGITNGSAVEQTPLVEFPDGDSNVGILRKIIFDAGPNGILKKQMIIQFPGEYTDKKEAVITNALTMLRTRGEIEGFKPKGVSMKGYYWRMKK